MTDRENCSNLPIANDANVAPASFKHKRGRFTNIRQKEIVVNLYNLKRKESPNANRTTIKQEISSIVGISRRTIDKILNEYLLTGW